ncbi:hypothetical protein EAH72_31330 [Pseudomonas caspiana]|nr:hypothetical protein EAH72_31330 [Pseudomonas caspiana]
MNVESQTASLPNDAKLITTQVGAGLLAKAVCQATMMSTVTPLSRASPLPQGFVSWQKEHSALFRRSGHADSA